MSRVKELTAFVAERKAKNDVLRAEIRDNTVAITDAEIILKRIEDNKFYAALEVISSGCVCAGVRCDNCIYDGHCSFNTLIDEARRIKKELEANNFTFKRHE
ncbi:MAG: hypothetical protein WC365_01375 [Candidatus Babeliales bacterium]|jgi:hypothetical protein